MRFVFITLVFVITSCVAFSSGRMDAVNASGNIETANTIDQPDAGENRMIKIIGRIHIVGPDHQTIFAVIEDQHDGMKYAIYPPSVEEELRGLQGHLIEFTVVKENTPKTYESLLLGRTVTVVEWRILQ